MSIEDSTIPVQCILGASPVGKAILDTDLCLPDGRYRTMLFHVGMPDGGTSAGSRLPTLTDAAPPHPGDFRAPGAKAERE